MYVIHSIAGNMVVSDVLDWILKYEPSTNVRIKISAHMFSMPNFSAIRSQLLLIK